MVRSPTMIPPSITTFHVGIQRTIRTVCGPRRTAASSPQHRSAPNNSRRTRRRRSPPNNHTRQPRRRRGPPARRRATYADAVEVGQGALLRRPSPRPPPGNSAPLEWLGTAPTDQLATTIAATCMLPSLRVVCVPSADPDRPFRACPGSRRTRRPPTLGGTRTGVTSCGKQL